MIQKITYDVIYRKINSFLLTEKSEKQKKGVKTILNPFLFTHINLQKIPNTIQYPIYFSNLDLLHSCQFSNIEWTGVEQFILSCRVIEFGTAPSVVVISRVSLFHAILMQPLNKESLLARSISCFLAGRGRCCFWPLMAGHGCYVITEPAFFEDKQDQWYWCPKGRSELRGGWCQRDFIKALLAFCITQIATSLRNDCSYQR